MAPGRLASYHTLDRQWQQLAERHLGNRTVSGPAVVPTLGSKIIEVQQLVLSLSEARKADQLYLQQLQEALARAENEAVQWQQKYKECQAQLQADQGTKTAADTVQHDAGSPAIQDDDPQESLLPSEVEDKASDGTVAAAANLGNPAAAAAMPEGTAPIDTVSRAASPLPGNNADTRPGAAGYDEGSTAPEDAQQQVGKNLVVKLSNWHYQMTQNLDSIISALKAVSPLLNISSIEGTDAQGGVLQAKVREVYATVPVITASLEPETSEHLQMLIAGISRKTTWAEANKYIFNQCKQSLAERRKTSNKAVNGSIE